MDLVQQFTQWPSTIIFATTCKRDNNSNAPFAETSLVKTQLISSHQQHLKPAHWKAKPSALRYDLDSMYCSRAFPVFLTPLIPLRCIKSTSQELYISLPLPVFALLVIMPYMYWLKVLLLSYSLFAPLSHFIVENKHPCYVISRHTYSTCECQGDLNILE